MGGPTVTVHTKGLGAAGVAGVAGLVILAVAVLVLVLVEVLEEATKTRILLLKPLGTDLPPSMEASWSSGMAVKPVDSWLRAWKSSAIVAGAAANATTSTVPKKEGRSLFIVYPHLQG